MLYQPRNYIWEENLQCERVIHESLNGCAFLQLYCKSEDDFSNVRSMLELKNVGYDKSAWLSCQISICLYLWRQINGSLMHHVSSCKCRRCCLSHHASFSLSLSLSRVRLLFPWQHSRLLGDCYGCGHHGNAFYMLLGLSLSHSHFRSLKAVLGLCIRSRVRNQNRRPWELTVFEFPDLG